MPSTPIYIADAFTNTKFGGNSAAVCPLEQEIPDATKQLIAREMNLSETAYITKLHSNDTFENSSHFKLRWFTPTTEVPLCGHATLAAAFVLFNVYKNSSEAMKFDTVSSGTLIAKKEGNRIVLDLPLNKVVDVDQKKIQNLLNAVVADIKVADVKFNPTLGYLLVRIADNYNTKDLEQISPSFDKVVSTSVTAMPEAVLVIVTLKGNEGSGFDFYSRVFAPRYGVNEDPVTGSAHTVSGPYWSKELGKTELEACQWSSRKGKLHVKVRHQDERVDVSGEGQLVLKGEISY